MEILKHLLEKNLFGVQSIQVGRNLAEKIFVHIFGIRCNLRT